MWANLCFCSSSINPHRTKRKSSHVAITLRNQISTMTSSTLHQLRYDQQVYHSASTMMSVCGDPTTRSSKSQAVAIQHSREDAQSRHQLLEEMRQKEAAAEYDWATWRMYNRIVDYRQKYPVKYSHEDEEESEEDTRPSNTKCVGGVASGTNGRFTNPKSESRVSFHPIQIDSPTPELYEDYGEIFQLDL